MKPLEEQFIEKFKIKELVIFESKSWIISFRPQQITVGSMVLSLNRYCPTLDEITEEESADLQMAFKKISEIFEQTFKPQKLNYLALMMFDEQVHFHVLPRYQSNIEIAGETFSDKGWPGPPSLEPVEMRDDIFQEIYMTLKESATS